MIAQKYGLDPRVVKEWPESVYREAAIVLQAEAGYQVTAEEVDEEAERRRRAMPTTGFVAGRDYQFWSKGIKGGVLDEEWALGRGGLTEEQLPEKIEEMTALGWLGAPDKIDTAPLEIPEEGEDKEPDEPEQD